MSTMQIFIKNFNLPCILIKIVLMFKSINFMKVPIARKLLSSSKIFNYLLINYLFN